MKNDKSGRIWQTKRKLSDRHGMTMIELLVVVAIIAILGGVSFVAVYRYQRSLGQVERDGIAKEIFVAAQNHLTVAKGEGYLGLADSAFGEPKSETVTVEGEPKTVTVYYIVVNKGSAFTSNGSSIVDQMLPFGSIDESIRTGGSYIIRYQKETGFVLDVFYCSTNASPKVFNHELKSEEYDSVKKLRDTEGSSQKTARRKWKDGCILGWYGGVEAIALTAETLQAPGIQVVNKETLSVIVTNNNGNTGGLRLLIKGKQSGVEHYLDVDDLANPKTTLYLDDITSSNLHFCKRQFKDMLQKTPPETNNGFIPGEDVTVQAVAYNNSTLSNIAFSAELTTNSLFAGVEDRIGADGIPDTALISNFRHLENLDKVISGLGYVDDNTYSDKVGIVSAVQTTNLNWNNDPDNNTVANANYWSSAVVTNVGGNAINTNQSAGDYVPIQPNYSLKYNGTGHSISNVNNDRGNQKYTVNAGLFGSVTTVSSISNLELIDFTITGTTSAGALAGSLTNCKVSNVLARNRPGLPAANSTAITATGSAGGLIGKLDGGSVSYSAAAMIVNGSADNSKAGGLIGEASGTVTVKGCYSGGHTINGSYKSWVQAHQYDVTGATAGGLIGDAGSATISNCYSTCSVSGTTAGGFVGSAGGKITDCYCTGLVSGNSAFIGSGKLANESAGNQYYKIVNLVLTKDDGGNVTAVSYKEPGTDYKETGEGVIVDNITPIEDDYNAFVSDESARIPAQPYDDDLITRYNGRFNLKSVRRLDATVTDSDFVSTHYGDWPSPEAFFVNNK